MYVLYKILTDLRIVMLSLGAKEHIVILVTIRNGFIVYKIYFSCTEK